jgi:hypothetical protein
LLKITKKIKMSYENRFSLKVRTPKTEMGKYCKECNTVKTGKFCEECGGVLIEKQVPYSVSKLDIIDKFRKGSEEASYLLGDSGKSYETGSGHTINDDLRKFSRKYPEVIFEFRLDPDSGFGDPPSIEYHKDGKVQRAKTTVIFEKFDINKLK